MSVRNTILLALSLSAFCAAQTENGAKAAVARELAGQTSGTQTDRAPSSPNASASVPAPSAPAAGAAAAPTGTPSQTARVPKSADRRDPFVSPVREATLDNPGANCNVGKRCLAPEDIVLLGVIQTKDKGNMALVENSEHKSTVLYENDQIFHGTVVRITGDSLVIQETVTDALGKKSTREVVKKVTTPAV